MVDSNPKTGRFATRAVERAVAVAGHGVATLLVSALLLWVYVDSSTLSVFVEVIDNPQFRTFLAPELLLHLGLSVCLWAFVYLLGSFLWRARNPAHTRLHTSPRTSRQGTVMTETIIALPVLLLLIFGIAQLTVNNIAGIFTNLATIQAARSAWLWEREPCSSIECDASERARIQAAAVLTPVAPGSMFIQDGGLPPAAARMLGVLVGAQDPQIGNDSGGRGMQTAARVSGRNPTSGSFSRALDRQSFTVRTIHKFTFAYHATDIEVSNPSGDVVRVDLTYRHHCAFPLVGRIFGEAGEVAGRPGYYADFTRSFEINRLPRPNRDAPIAPDSPKLY
jgi:hypothetical protein